MQLNYKKSFDQSGFKLSFGVKLALVLYLYFLTLQCELFAQSSLYINASNSPFNIDSPLTIPVGDSLIIGPGAEVFIADSVDIHVHGTVSIKGTADQPVRLQGQSSSVGWGTIVVGTAVDSLSVEHAIIENGRFIVFDCHTRFSHVRFENNQNLVWNDAIARLFEGSLLVDSCEVIGSNKGEGFLCHDIQNPIVTHNYFERIPDAVEYLSCVNGRIGMNRFVDNFDDAIDLNNCSNMLVDSNVISNVLDRGMEIGSEGLGSSSNIHVYRNLIVNCGTGINFKEGSTGFVENNTIHQNGIGIDAIIAGSPAVGSQVEVVNCILSKNDVPTHVGEGSTLNVNYSLCTEAVFPGFGNIKATPLFNAASNGDFSLNVFSPCIDAGASSSPADPDGTVCDIGAFFQSERSSIQVGERAILLWPNPVENTAHVYMSGVYEKILIFNAIGEVIHEVELNGQVYLELKLSHLNSGTYQVELIKGEEKVSTSFIKL